MVDIEKLKALAEEEISLREAGKTSDGELDWLAVDELLGEEIGDRSKTILELIAEIERLRHSSAWVSVEDRLPESGAPVLVWCDGCGCAGVAWIRQGAWLMPEPQPLGYESITHWMPLPAGPTATESRP